MSRLRLAVVTSVVLAAAACQGSDVGPNISGVSGVSIADVRVTPESSTVFIPDSVRPIDRVQLRGVAYSYSRQELTGVQLAWYSSDSTVARVDGNGLVTPRSPGVATIFASASKVGKAKFVVIAATTAVQVEPGLDSVFVDDPIDMGRDTVRLRARGFDAMGRPLTGVRFTWESSQGSVASVDSTGLVRAMSLGTTTVAATANGSSAATSIVVLPVVASVQVTSPVSALLAGDTLDLTARAFGYAGESLARPFAWSSSAPDVAAVDPTGRAIFGAAGQTTFTASSAFRSGLVTVTAYPRALLAVEAGSDFACGLAALGRGYCWGIDDAGQLASAADSACFPPSGSASPCALVPRRMDRPEISFLQVSAGGDFGCGISSDNMIYCWGADTFGQLGNGLQGGPGPVLATAQAHQFTAVTAGSHHACALNAFGVAYCWGLAADGQLGNAQSVNSSTPIPVADTTLLFRTISAGDGHTCALTADGRAYCWGRGSSGQLGSGSLLGSDVPTLVQGGHNFVALGVGADHTCASAVTGTLYCWGKNDRGQLGLGYTGPPVLTPTAVGGIGSVTSIAAGGNHTCVIGAGGAVACWGASDYGEVGDGSTLSHTVVSPAPVAGFAASVLSSGTRHTCAVSAIDLRTYCWGSNIFGALGNESQAAARATPQVVARLR